MVNKISFAGCREGAIAPTATPWIRPCKSIQCWCSRWWMSSSPTVWHKRDCCRN